MKFAIILALALSPLVASAHGNFTTKRISPRASCGNAANEYCVDVSDNEVPCTTRAAEWKICVYAGDEDSTLGEAAFSLPSPGHAACKRQCATSWDTMTGPDGAYTSEADCVARHCGE